MQQRSRVHGRDPDDRPANDDLWSLLSLVGEEVRIVQPQRDARSSSGGGDVDCVARRLDHLWPLRLPPGWTLCGIRHHEVGGATWLLKRDNELVVIDAVEDPMGLGRAGIPTGLLLGGVGPLARPGARAAYLTEKRLAKGSRHAADWEAIQSLAESEPGTYRSVLTAAFGRRLGAELSAAGLRGLPPDPALVREVRRLRLLRRSLHPGRALLSASLELARLTERVLRPTGLSVVIAGPDGSGKSTVARGIGPACAGLFSSERRFHWRPGLLPAPGALAGRQAGDPTEPHAEAPHGRLVSALRLGYFWSDFVLGTLFRTWPIRLRSGIVVLERGWWDMAVDPLRYRLDVPRWLLRFMGSLTPGPDLTIVLESTPDVLLERKAELGEQELSRQVAAWRRVMPRRARVVYLDAARPLDEVLSEAREEIVRLLEARTVSRLGAGWTSLPAQASARWSLPRGPRRTARNGMLVYQPVTIRGRLGWESARVLALTGFWRLLPRGPAPPRGVREALAPYVSSRGTLAVAKGNHPGRYTALVLDDRGECRGVAKVATEASDGLPLQREGDRLEALAGFLSPPLSGPRILARTQGLLLFEAVSWLPRWRSWRLPEGVARALGTFFREGSENSGSEMGPAHGDCAPWNLLRTRDGWVLVDWEQASTAEAPFFDLAHYVVQAHLLLGRPSERTILRGFIEGRGWIGRAVAAYADGAGMTTAGAAQFLGSYLRVTEQRLTPTFGPESPPVLVRQHLLARLART